MKQVSQQDALQARLTVIRRAAEERDAERRAKKSGYPYADLTKVPVALDAIKTIPEAGARDAKLAAIEIKARELAVAVFDPQSPSVQAVLQDLEKRKYTTKLFVVSLSSLNEAWKLYKFAGSTAKDITGKVEIEKQRFEGLLKQLITFEAIEKGLANSDFHKITTTNLFEIILAGALATNASDIHFEAEEEHVRIRLRLDGALHDISSALPLKNYNSLLSRIKLLSGLKINVYGEPQDGRFTIDLPSKEVEMRVSIIPSEFGETIVMRVLDPETTRTDLHTLGLREDILAIAKIELGKPNGLILNTGPTGSGKTTTLYAFLRSILNPEIKIITIEDPIEYQIDGIEQTQTNSEAGYTFAGGLRAIMRQDPDVILVGEIRDKETADIAMQASLTGHLVLSTLHANSAVATVARLVDLGVRPETVGPALGLVIAQRLVRILCEKCKKEAATDAATNKKISNLLDSLPSQVNKIPYSEFKIYQRTGCAACNGTGYKGRAGIFEFLVAGPMLEEVILREASENAVRKFAEEQGMVTLQKDGILKVLLGVTDFAEVEKITGPIEWGK